MARVDHLQHDTTCKPQSSIGRSCGSPEGSTTRLHTIKRVEGLELHGDVRLSPPSLHFCTCNFDEPALCVQPKSALAVLNEGIHNIARKAVPDCEGLLLSFLPSDDS